MEIVKGICLCLALFTSLLYINNVLADIASLISWNSTLHTPEDMKSKDKDAFTFAKFRIVLIVLMSIFWTLYIVI